MFSFLWLLLLTVLVVFWKAAAIQFLNGVHFLYIDLMGLLQRIINGSHYAALMRQIIVLLLVPAIIALIPAFLYWILRRRWLYEYMIIVWCVWMVLVTVVLWGSHGTVS